MPPSNGLRPGTDLWQEMAENFAKASITFGRLSLLTSGLVASRDKSTMFVKLIGVGSEFSDNDVIRYYLFKLQPESGEDQPQIWILIKPNCNGSTEYIYTTPLNPGTNNVISPSDLGWDPPEIASFTEGEGGCSASDFVNEALSSGDMEAFRRLCFEIEILSNLFPPAE